MKRKGVLLLLLLMILLLTGCGDAPKVGICLGQTGDSMTAEYLQSMTQALTEAGYQVTSADAGEDQANQTRQVEKMIREEYDLLIVEPVMMELAGSLAELAKQAGVPMIFVGYEPSQETLDTWNKVCYVGTREEEPGTLQGQVAKELPDGGDLNGDGTVSYIIIAGPEDHLDALARTESCMASVQGNCIEVTHGQWSKESGQLNCSRMLAAYGKDIEVVFCNSDTLAQGALSAIRDGGRTVGQDIYLLGLGGDKQSRLLVRSGDLSGTVYLDMDAQADLLTKTVKTLLSGRIPEKQQYGEYILLTQDNVEDYL